MIRFAPISQDSSLKPSMQPASGLCMEQSSGSNRQLSDKRSTDVGRRLALYLRRLYPRDVAKNVAADTGLSITTVQKLLERESAPNAAGYVALTLVYGPEFLAAVLPSAPGWLERAVRMERLAQLEAERARIERELREIRQ